MGRTQSQLVRDIFDAMMTERKSKWMKYWRGKSYLHFYSKFPSFTCWFIFHMYFHTMLLLCCCFGFCIPFFRWHICRYIQQNVITMSNKQVWEYFKRVMNFQFYSSSLATMRSSFFCMEIPVNTNDCELFSISTSKCENFQTKKFTQRVSLLGNKILLSPIAKNWTLISAFAKRKRKYGEHR